MNWTATYGKAHVTVRAVLRASAAMSSELEVLVFDYLHLWLLFVIGGGERFARGGVFEGEACMSLSSLFIFT